MNLDDLPTFALSVRQPWAWAIIHAGKRLENRSALSISKGGMKPGRICIHASTGMTKDEYESGKAAIEYALEWDFCAEIRPAVPRPDELLRGGIIGLVTVTRTINKSGSRWFVGPKALVLENPEPCEPIPVAGGLGYFEWRKYYGQHFSRTALEEPKPWMLAWPEQLRPARKSPAPPATPEPMALFEQSPDQAEGKSDG